MDEIEVDEEISGAAVEERKVKLPEPVRVYKDFATSNSLRGMDFLGDGLTLRDRPILMEGVITIIEDGAQRCRVAGRARAEVGGALYKVRG